MTTLREAAQQALEALERADKISKKAVTALRQALEAKQQDKPVAWRSWNDAEGIGLWESRDEAWLHDSEKDPEPIYTNPKPKLQPLTEMEIVELRQLTPGTLDVQFVKFARAIERAHGIGGAA